MCGLGFLLWALFLLDSVFHCQGGAWPSLGSQAASFSFSTTGCVHHPCLVGAARLIPAGSTHSCERKETLREEGTSCRDPSSTPGRQPCTHPPHGAGQGGAELASLRSNPPQPWPSAYRAAIVSELVPVLALACLQCVPAASVSRSEWDVTLLPPNLYTCPIT